MIETSKACPQELHGPGVKITPENEVVWQMMQNSANDNLMPTVIWFKWLVFWAIFVGSVLTYIIF